MQQDIQDRQSAVRRPQSELEAARAVLARAVGLRDAQAAYWAAKINQASTDSLTDHESRWGDITGGFDELVGAVGMLGSGASAVLGGVSSSLGGGTEGGALFSSGSATSNADVVNSGAGLARTFATVSDVAARAGVDLVNSEVKIIEDPEYLRYLDSVGACACAPYDLPGEIPWEWNYEPGLSGSGDLPACREEGAYPSRCCLLGDDQRGESAGIFW